jgi:serine/threonine protein kinase
MIAGAHAVALLPHAVFVNDVDGVQQKVLQQLRHPHIIHLQDVYESESRIYMVMELMDGESYYSHCICYIIYMHEYIANCMLFVHRPVLICSCSYCTACTLSAAQDVIMS